MAIPVYKLSVEEILKQFATTADGISFDEAKIRRGIYGMNRLETVKKNKMIFKFLRQFTDLMVLMLLISGLFSLYLKDYIAAGVILVIVILNATIGFIQEFKAERVMDSLNKLVKAKARVVRAGKLTEINAEEIVPGDIVALEGGDRVPADMRIMSQNELATNDFSLTGESNPVRKFTHPINEEVLLGDRNNIVFMGTTVATGNAQGVAVATGMKTEIGRIAHLSQTTKTELSPLQKELNHMAKKLTYVAMIIAGIIFGVAIFRHSNLREAFVFAVAVASSIVPQAVPAQISVALSLSAGRLAKKRAVVKKLSAVETMGSTHIICTDKTGTLTKNEMTVQKFLIGRQHYEVKGIGYEPKGKIFRRDAKFCVSTNELKILFLFFQTGILASNAEIFSPDAEHPTWYCIGDPTEAALITLGEKAGLSQKDLNAKYKELREFTFDAGRKVMSSVRQIENKMIRVYSKGAPLSILDRCTQIWDGTSVRPITEQDRGFMIEQYGQYAKQALRVLAYAYRDLSDFNKDMTMGEVEEDLVFLGLVAMIDPPREEVAAAIEAAKRAFIRVIIITGDYALTAEAIAKRIGIGGEKQNDIKVLTTDDLAKMSDIALLHSLINENIIFSRTSPEDKLRIVDLLKKAGEIVAVTGDGVNDAPALKRADIGVAMGKTGTDVAKDSAEIILLDDSFGTLVSAISEGRLIYANLKKTIIATLDLCGGELFVVLFSILFGYFFQIPAAILAIQILAIDLLAETLPLTFLTWDRGEQDLMNEVPRNPNQFILNGRRLFDIAGAGFLIGGLAYLNFILLARREGFSWSNFSDTSNMVYARATTLTYVTLVLIQLFANLLSRRTKRSIFTSYVWSNPRLLLSYAFSLFCILNISYNPYIQPFFQSGPLTMSDWLMAILMVGVYLGVREGWKKVSKLSS